MIPPIDRFQFNSFHLKLKIPHLPPEAAIGFSLARRGVILP